MSSFRVTTHFKDTQSDEFLLSAAKKTTSAYRTVIFTDSLLKVLIATSKLVSNFFKPKFPIGGTKC